MRAATSAAELARDTAEAIAAAAGAPGGVATLIVPSVDWVALAGGLGVPAGRADSVAGLREALARSLAEPGPHLIEMVL